jgi:hypothetical protein
MGALTTHIVPIRERKERKEKNKNLKQMIKSQTKAKDKIT